MFVALLAVLLIAWAIHARRNPVGPGARGELLLLYVLVGYCGIPMIVVALLFLAHPHEGAEVLGLQPDHPFGLFLGWAYLGMALTAAAALRFRGTYLVGPAVTWTVFFAGATGVHVGMSGGTASMGHGDLLMILGAHGLVSLLLVAGLWTSGLMRREAAPSSRS